MASIARGALRMGLKPWDAAKWDDVDKKSEAAQPPGLRLEVDMCDEDCEAFEYPETPDEYRATLLHYKYHEVDHGCSHGR